MDGELTTVLPPPSMLDGEPLDGEETTRLPQPEPVTSGRHTVPDELVQAATYRLNPDRVARAKVHDAGTSDEETTRLPPVPRPRSS